MIPRQISNTLKNRLQTFPAVVVVGPRQCGKTTLAKSFECQYFDLEQEADRLRLDLQWEQVLMSSSLVVLDEAQAWPEVFNRLRGAIDGDRRRKGRFLLLGSISPSLMRQVSESLAGRLALIELTPFTLEELEDPVQWSRHWLVGGYPDGGILTGSGYPIWHLDYLMFLVHRDLVSWGLPANPTVIDKFLHMIAHVHAQEWNASMIARSMGVSHHTVNNYLGFLEHVFLIRHLPAYYANVGKRLVKRPKVYWRDTGLLHALRNVQDEKALTYQPWVGASWEGYVIEQVLAALRQLDVRHQAFFFRTVRQQEIDLLLEIGSELWAIEIKLSTNPQRSDLEKLGKTADLVSAHRRFLICRSKERISAGNEMVCDIEDMIKYMRSQFS